MNIVSKLTKEQKSCDHYLVKVGEHKMTGKALIRCEDCKVYMVDHNLPMTNIYYTGVDIVEWELDSSKWKRK